MAALRTINLILAFIATTAPLAHILECHQSSRSMVRSGLRFSSTFTVAGARFLAPSRSLPWPRPQSFWPSLGVPAPEALTFLQLSATLA